MFFRVSIVIEGGIQIIWIKATGIADAVFKVKKYFI